MRLQPHSACTVEAVNEDKKATPVKFRWKPPDGLSGQQLVAVRTRRPLVYRTLTPEPLPFGSAERGCGYRRLHPRLGSTAVAAVQREYAFERCASSDDLADRCRHAASVVPPLFPPERVARRRHAASFAAANAAKPIGHPDGLAENDLRSTISHPEY